MQSIEEQLHALLQDIAPSVYNKEEESKIIAHASSLYNSLLKNRRVAKTIDDRTRQGHMNDVILKAMASLSDWDTYEEEEYIETVGLSSKAVLHKIAQSKSKWGIQEVLNPEALSYLEVDEDIDSEQSLENGDNQTDEALKTPGVGRHRSDFLTNTSPR